MKLKKAEVKFRGSRMTVDKDAFEAHLPDELTKETFTKVDQHRDRFAKAVGQAAVEHIEQEGVDKLESTTHMGGKTKLSLNFNRDQNNFHIAVLTDYARTTDFMNSAYETLGIKKVSEDKEEVES